MRSIIILFLFSLFLTSCANTLYIGKLAWGEAKILGGTVPNEEVLNDKGVDEKIKDGIRLAQEVKEFSRQRLGLRLDGSYETFYRVKGDALIHLVSACTKDSLEPYTWCFPVVGEVEYKGFFSKKDAVKEIQKLEGKGLDTSLQQAIAFSTLGWLSDPLYSTVLDQHPVIVINIIIHEIVHNTIFFKGETEFNEQVASLIAEKGSLMFIEERFGLRSPAYQLALNLVRDEELKAGFFQGLYDVLKGLYARDLSREEKLSMREEIFVLWQRRLVELNKQLKVEGDSEPIERLNNAVVLAYRRYLPSSASLLQQAYEALGNDVQGLVELLLTMRKAKEPPSFFLKR
ncbi:MAG: aminopeptidase, partial [Desulfobacterales bacterium]|nr:aminopeptidase [Desulfobacterales bacterium]